MVDFRHVHICNITPALQTGILLRKERLCQFTEQVGQVVAVENRLVRCPPNNAVIFVHLHVYVERHTVVLIERIQFYLGLRCFFLYSSRSLREPEISASVLGNLN